MAAAKNWLDRSVGAKRRNRSPSHGIGSCPIKLCVTDPSRRRRESENFCLQPVVEMADQASSSAERAKLRPLTAAGADRLLFTDVPGLSGLQRKLEKDFHLVSCDLSPALVRRVRQESFDTILVDFDWDPLCALQIVRDLRVHEGLPPVIALCDGSRADLVIEASNGLIVNAFSSSLGAGDMVARIRQIIGADRDSRGGSRLSYDDLMLDQAQMKAWRGGRLLPLTTYQFRLLNFLMLHPETLFDRHALLDAVWQKETSDSAVTACVARLRRLLNDGEERDLIRSVRGRGYALDATVGHARRSSDS